MKIDTFTKSTLMNRKSILSFVVLPLLMMHFSFFGQEKNDTINKKDNTIIYTDINLGYTNGSFKGFTGGLSINYQRRNNLFTFRFFETYDIKKIYFILIPIPDINLNSKEFSFLYGKRYIEDGFSYHFTGGVSYNKINNNSIKEDYFGLPLEFGLNWFKSRKKRFGVLYGLVPVGKPTGFGRSFGVKLYTNIAKKTYVGIGLTYGFGWYKKY